MIRLTRTIAFRLFVLLATVQTVVLLALTYGTVRVQQSNLMENVIQGATRVSDLIGRSARHSMLLNRKEDVSNIVASIGGEPGIEGIRIYNKQGEVVFGTVPADLYTRVDVNAEACNICHGSNGLENPHPPDDRLSRIFTKPSGERVLGLITPIRNEQQCAEASCHAHPPSKTILGVLDVKMSLAQVDRRLEESRTQLLLLSGAAVLLVGFVSGAFIWTVVRRPVNKLMAGMEMVSTGRLDQRLEARTNDELGRLALKFNEMTSDLARARREITEWSGTLEQKVEEKTAELEKAHKQMLRVEKMASLGNLASSVAHELNNPLEGILTFARLLMKRIQKSALPAEEAQSYYNDLKLVAEEAQRCGDIVKNLLLFSRQKGMAFQVIHVKAILDRCCLLVKHYAAMNNVELRARCTNDDELECDPGQVQQVLVALMMNGIEAMSTASDRAEGGLLSVDVCRAARGDDLTVHVSDTGMGISDDVKRHMFEPFFTTKSEGKGVGLGLAITYGIVERHHGSIEVESTVGRGTTFTVVFPARQPVDDRGRTLSSSVEGVHK